MAVAADRRVPTHAPAPGLLVQSDRVLRQLERKVREAKGVLYEFRRLAGYDIFGRYPLACDEEITDDVEGAVIELMHRARQSHPTQDIEVIFVARHAQGRSDDGGQPGQ